jgi:zinc protease
MSSPPSVGPLRAPRAPALTELELTGGLHAIAVRRPQVPLVQVRLVFPMPARDMSRPAPSLVLSESILSGTERHDREGLAAAVERLGGTLTATLAGERFVLGASCLAPCLGALMELIGEVLTGATYPAPEVKADRARTADRVILLLSRPEVLADEAFAKRLFGNHPYGAPVARPDALLRVGAPALRRLHRSLLQAKSAHLVVVGDIQPKRALAAAEAGMSNWLETRSPGVPPLRPVPAPEPGPLLLVDRPGSVQSNLRLGGAAPARSSADWPAALIANEILGGMFTSRIVENLRERNGYTYSPRSTISHGRAGSTLSIAAEVSTEVTAAALVEARYELGRIATTGVTADEVDAACRYAVGSFLVRTATQAGLASTLATLAVEGTSPGYLSAHPARIARTTKAEVDEAARRHLSPAAMVAVVVGDAGAVGEPLALVDAVRTQ